MQPWTHNGVAITTSDQFPPDAIGFTYRITDPDGKIYIGKKALLHTKKVTISIKEKLETKTRKTFRTTTKDSGWVTYYGSCKELKAAVKVKKAVNFKREILSFSCSKKNLTYMESKAQFAHNVLELDTYNGNIAGKFFRKDTVNCPEKVAA